MFEFAAFCILGPGEGPKNFEQHKINSLILFMSYFLNPNWHELKKQEKCSPLAPPRSKFYKTQWAWQACQISSIWKFLIQIHLTNSNPKITRGVKVPCLMPIRVKVLKLPGWATWHVSPPPHALVPPVLGCTCTLHSGIQKKWKFLPCKVNTIGDVEITFYDTPLFGKTSPRLL